jgi:ATPase family associated with various cellular activities (AAA)/Winged helix domain, variant
VSVLVVSAPTNTPPRWLVDVRLRTQRRVLWCRELWARNRYVGEESLAITHSEVELALASPEALLEAERDFHANDENARLLTAELEAIAEHEDPRWLGLAVELGLAPAEQQLLALALAAELAPALRRVYGYLQDETVPLDPTPALVGELWGHAAPPRFDRDSALVRWELARPADSVRDRLSSSTGWLADPLLLDWLLGDGKPGPHGRRVDAPAGPRVNPEQVDEIVCFVESLSDAPALGLELELVGPKGSGRATLAAHVAARLGREVFAVDAAAVAADPDPVAAIAREARSARLAGALLVWRNANELTEPLLAETRTRLPLTFLAAEEQLPIAAAAGTARRSYTVEPLARSERLRLWSAASDAPAPEPVAEWQLRPAEIETIARIAAAGDDAVREVCRRLLMEAPHELLSSLSLPYTWDDLVVAPGLAAHLREFESQAQARGEVLDGWGLGRLTPLGRGVSALFAGPSGTGKTMAAQVLARSLGRELYRVDLAGVVNKYIGETEKHLRAVFASCERAPVMLFFDEADALFGKRMQVNDAHDRFANIEVDYLLQRMEQFDGVAVLATNRKGDLDTAFMRRLRFTIDFAPPTIEERERLWRLALERSVDGDGKTLVGEIDWPHLANELDLTGAGIKASALAAAFLARSDGSRIETRHLVAAARRELEKQGIVVRAGQRRGKQ